VTSRSGITRERARDYVRAWSDYQDFARDTGRSTIRGVAAPPEPPERVKGRRKRQGPTRKREALSIEPKDWKALRNAVEADPSAQARVIEVMMATGLRVGDVLRIPPTRLRAAFQREDGLIRLELKGGKLWTTSVQGAPESWQRLAKVCGSAPTVAGAVNTKGDPDPEARAPGYEAVRWRFAKLAELAGVEGRIYLHRLRRTVAVRALKKGISQEVVGKLLGHADTRTTAIYQDESMADLAAQTQRKIRED
jgi:integrase